jgi:DNA invertase Pin-like site-specific DNA recombinase
MHGNWRKYFAPACTPAFSTSDQQTIPLRIRGLREYAARRGWQIALQVKEVGSGASERQLWEKLLDAARRREIDVVLVWRLDRAGGDRGQTCSRHCRN